MKNMRRKDREISLEEARVLLEHGEYGVLSTVGCDGQPYGIPLSYVFKNDGIYFHCARSGRKLEHIEASPKVSFCVVGDTRVLPSQFATEYESAVAFGLASELHGPERHQALLWLLEKYSKEFLAEGRAYIEQYDQLTRVFKIQVEHITGKARR